MKSYYDQISSGYDELHSEEQKKKLAIIKKLIGRRIKKDSRLLDVGCGTGLSSDFDCFVVGVDPSSKLLKIARKKKKPDQGVLAKAEDLPFDDRTFDFIISLTAIQNFNDIKKGLSEMKRVAKKDAIFALSFLKKSQKREKIEGLIKKMFKVREKVEEEKDIIYTALNPQ